MPTSLGSSPAARQIGAAIVLMLFSVSASRSSTSAAFGARAPPHNAAKPAAASARPRNKAPNRVAVTRPPITRPSPTTASAAATSRALDWPAFRRRSKPPHWEWPASGGRAVRRVRAPRGKAAVRGGMARRAAKRRQLVRGPARFRRQTERPLRLRPSERRGFLAHARARAEEHAGAQRTRRPAGRGSAAPPPAPPPTGG